MVHLIIAEKPTAAKKIADAILGEYKTKKKYSINYYESREGIIVAPAAGHLFTLRDKKNKGYPNFDLEWQPSFKKNKFTKNFYQLLSYLGKFSDNLTIATDLDIEGEVIGYNIYRFLCKKAKVHRMEFSTLTKEELKKSFENRKKGYNIGLAESGLTRHYLDFYYGVNISKALTSSIKTSSDRYYLLTSGRVQGPALAILAEREEEIKNFVPTPFYQLNFTTSKSEKRKFKSPLTFNYEVDKIWKKEEAEKIFSDCKNKDAIVSKIEKNKRKLNPPVPFNLSGLQSEAYKVFGFTPARTQSIAQRLYLQSLISYPRTSSQKLPPSIDYKNIIEKLSERFEIGKNLLGRDLKPNEGKKTDPAHPCFTSDTIISLNPKKISFENLAKSVRKWEWDSEKNSFFGRLPKKYVYSFGDKIEKSKVTGIWKTPYDSEMLRIKIDKSEIKVTPNHEFLVLNKESIKYTPAKNLREGDYLFFKRDVEDKPYKIKLKECDFKKAFPQWEKRNTNKTFVKLISYLENLTLKKVIILAKICGFCLGDGHISFKKPSKNREKYPAVCFVGEKEDMMELKKDIEKLGFSSFLIHGNKNYYYLNSKNSLFGRLLIVLGCETGDKVSKVYSVPKWINEGDIEIKKGFLQGIFGAELTKVRIHSANHRDIKAFTFNQHKIKELAEKGVEFCKELKELCSEFGVETSEIYLRDRIVRKKDKKSTVEIGFNIKNNRDNLKKFLLEIGYAYSGYKDKLGRKALAYLIIRDLLVKEKLEKKNKALQLYKEGKSYREIEKILGVSCHTIRGWIYYKKGEKEKHVSTRDLPVFEKFELTIPKDLIPKRIEKIDKFCFKGHVYDLEVEKNHNYFANNFLVHNCIYPTGERPKKLKADEEKLYSLIVHRFFSVFGEPAERLSIKILADIGKYRFHCSGVRTIKKNWLEFYPFAKIEEVELPELEKGEILIVDRLNLLEKETSPPPRYNQASLVKELEKRNLGTKSTRALIVQTLYDRNYIEGKQIKVTDLGMNVVRTLKKYAPEFLSEKLTAKFELEMEKVEQLKKKREEVLEEARKLLTKTFNKFKKREKEVGNSLMGSVTKTREEQNTLGKCNKCGGELKFIQMYNGSRFVGCSNYPKCKNSYPLPKNCKIEKTEKICEHCGTPILKIIRKGKRSFNMCLDPNCKSKENWGKNKNKD